jgi:hypothetical protein
LIVFAICVKVDETDFPPFPRGDLAIDKKGTRSSVLSFKQTAPPFSFIERTNVIAIVNQKYHYSTLISFNSSVGRAQD